MPLCGRSCAYQSANVAEYRHSKKAEADLLRAIKYSLKEHGAQQGEKYLNTLEDACPTRGEKPNQARGHTLAAVRSRCGNCAWGTT
jgi:plasmid stabilization system protein ParE